jgi:ABC-type phosphate transport system substrate-binding protein
LARARRPIRAGAMRLLAALVLALAADLSGAVAETLTVAGATTFNNHIFVPHLAEIEARSGYKLVVIPNRNDLGIVLLMEGRADLAMISASLEGTISSLRRTQPTLPLGQLMTFEIHRTRVAFSVHPTNPVRTASLATLRRVLLGEIANWRALGGPDLPIRIVMVKEGAGIPLEIQSRLLAGKRIDTANAIAVQISTQVNKIVEQEPGALGLAQIENMAQHNVAEIKTDRLIERELALVTLGEPSPAARAVIDAARAAVRAALR